MNSFLFVSFSDYGEEWLDSREGTFADYIPRQSDFTQAASIVRRIKQSERKDKLVLNGKLFYSIKHSYYSSLFGHFEN